MKHKRSANAYLRQFEPSEELSIVCAIQFRSAGSGCQLFNVLLYEKRICPHTQNHGSADVGPVSDTMHVDSLELGQTISIALQVLAVVLDPRHAA